MIKYPATIGNCLNINNKKLIFTIEETSDLTILHRMNSSTLNGYHVIPEYIEVANQLGEKCSDMIVGQNTDNMGRIKLTCDGGFSIQLNGDSSLTIDNEEGGEKNKRIEEKSCEIFNAIDVSEMDTVEQLVLMANIIMDIVKKQK